MRWLLLALQWLYPLVLLLAATSRASLPSFVYLLACFVYAWSPPLRQLVPPTTVRPGDQTAIGTATPGAAPGAAASAARHRHQRTKSNALTLSASSSFLSPSTLGTSHASPAIAPSAASPFEQTSTWQVHRSFFVCVCAISGLTLVAQLVVHALYWSEAWRPDGQWDGHTRVERSPVLLLQVLELFQLAPWASAREGVQSLLPDFAMLATSIFAAIIVRLDGNGRIRWVRRAYCCGDSADELSGLGRGSLTRSQATGSGSALSAAVMLLHFFICVSLFCVAILQPSLLSLPYFVALAVVILAQVLCERPEATGGGGGSAGGPSDSDMGFFQQLLFVQGSSVQYGALSVSTMYLYSHLVLIHVLQFSIVLQHIDRTSVWLGRLGLFLVDVTTWSNVIVIQWAFLVSLVCCLVAVSLKRLSLQVVSTPVLTLSSFERRAAPAQQPSRAQAALGEMVSPVSPFLASQQVPRRSLVQREGGEFKSAAPSHLHASPGVLESPSPSPPAVSAFSIRRSLFAQSSFELKSFIHRSFRNHGLLLICALVLVQVMMVHDLFNVVNVGLLLTCMSIANVPRARSLLIALLHFQVVFILASTLVKYLFYIPFLLDTPIPADSDPTATRESIEEAWGLIKHEDGFTSHERTQGSFVFLYLLNSVLPAVLIAVYLIVHRVSAAHLTVLNLFNGASTGDTVLLQRFIDTSPAMLAVRDRTHKTVLHIAASNGHLATVRLVMNYVDVNAQDKLGNSALHYAYKYGFDSVVHLLLSSGSKGSLQSGRGRQSLNLINSELTNKKGLKPAEMKQRWFTKVMRRVRSIVIVIEGFFYLHASKLTLLLLFIVASQSVNLLHMVYFIFFLLFFSMETVAQRLWNVLVAYCALVFFVLYTFSVVEPLYSLRTREVNEGTDWIRYLGLFSVRDDAEGQKDTLSQWWSNLLIYYGAYVLAVMQKMVYRRGEELGMIQSIQQQQTARSGGASFLTDETDGDLSLDWHLRARTARRPSRLTRVSIVMLTYLTLIIVAMIDVSLFHLGYLLILLLSLAVHQWAAQAGRVLSAFWFLCIVYTASVLFAQYAYLLPEFRRWLTRHFNWHRFSLYDIGFRSPAHQANHNGGSVDDEFTSDSILLILLPPTACFVMCAYYLKTLWRELRGKAAIKEQGAVDRLAGAVAARPTAHVASRDTPAPAEAGAPAATGGFVSRRKQFGTMKPSRSPPTLSILPRHRRTSSTPPAEQASPSWLAEVHEVASPQVPELAGAGAGTGAGAAPAATTIDIAPSPSGRVSAGLLQSASMVDFSLFTPKQRAQLHTQLYAAYLFGVNVLAHQTTQLLVLFILLYVLLIDPLSLLNLVYLLILLVWLPFDGRSLDNSLWLPLTVYSIPLITAKYLFQFPSLVSAETDLSKWIGFSDFHGHLIRNLIGDLVILTLATMQRVATKTMRKMLAEKKRMQQLQKFTGAPAAGASTSASATEATATGAAQRHLSPLEQQHQREQTAMAIEAERLRKQHELLDTLAEEDETAAVEAASPLAYSVRSYQQEEPISAGARQGEAVWTEEKKSSPAPSAKQTATRNVHASPPPSASAPASAKEKPSQAKLRRSELAWAAARELWVHMLDVLASFYRHYGLEIFLLFLLLMSYARSNVMSLVYVLFFCGCWIQFDGRSVLVRSRVLCWSLLALLGLSVVWQYAVLLGMPPDWRSSHNYLWHDWDSVVQQWMMVGHFTTRDLMWDCWSFVFLAWFMPYWKEERAALDAEGRLQGDSCWPCARDPESASASPVDRSVIGSAMQSGTTTPHRLHKSLLPSEHGRAQSESRAKDVGFGHMYEPPSMEPVQLEKATVELDEESGRDTHALNLLKLSATRASSDKRVRYLWPKILFYSGLVIDKLLFVFIFFIGTSHNNLFSCVYLVFSCWYLLQNHLFDLQPQQFRHMWRTLRKWNFAILVCLVLYQIPWVPYLFLSDATLRWEMFIGLHKFVRPPPDSRYDTPAYLRVYTNPLGDRGALPQIFIFLLIEAQLLVIESRVFRSSVLGYFRDMRRMSAMRCDASTLLYKEWLVQRIKTILLFREKLEASFTYIFLEASKLNGDYFQDEMVWPQPKPSGWDERVNNLLLEDSLKAFEFNKDKERKNAEAAGLAPHLSGAQGAQGSAINQEAGAVFSGATTPGVPRTPHTPPSSSPSAALGTETRPLPKRTLTDSETDGGGQQGIMSAFRGTLQGPLQISTEDAAAEESDSDSPTPLAPPTGTQRSTKERQASSAAGSDESEQKPSSQSASDSPADKPPKGNLTRFLRWLKKPLLRHIDSVFWTEYAVDPATRELVVVSVPDAHSLSFGQAVWRFVLSNTQWLCFFFFFINLLVNGNLLSMVVPVLILVYALFERPRAPRGFWLFALLWSSIVVSAKFVFQLYIFCAAIETSGGTAGAVQLQRKYIFAPSPYCVGAAGSNGYSVDALLGLRKLSTHTYFTIILIDIVCMLSIVLHRTVMMARGLWDTNEEEELAKQERRRRIDEERAMAEEQEAEEQAEAEAAKPVADAPTEPSKGAIAGPKQPALKLRPSRTSVLDGIEAEVKRRATIDIEKLTATPMSPHHRHGSSTGELNTSASELQMTLWLLQREEEQQEEDARATRLKEKTTLTIMGKLRRLLTRWWFKYAPLELQYYYADLMPRERFHYVNVHKPGYDFYIYLFLIELVSSIFILICYDNMASTSLNTVSTSLSTNLFSGNMVVTLFVQIFIIILDRVCYLFRSILSKLLLQYATILYWFIKIFFQWPVSSQSAFIGNSYLQFFFVLKLLYFVCSGLQLHAGFPPLETAGFQYLTRTPGVYHIYAYKLYRAIPFVFELRTMLDWMCAVSSLDLWDTLRLEEIHGGLYAAQCDILYRRLHERGTPRALIEKFCSGVLLFLLLLLIIFGPLLLFSTANPVSQNNPVVSASVSLSLSGRQGEYPLVDISSFVLQPISSDFFVTLQNEDLLQDSDRADAIQSVQMAPYSDHVWDISPPSLSQLMHNLNDHTQAMSVKFQYSFTRSSGPQNDKTISNVGVVTLDQKTQQQLAHILNQTLTADQQQGDDGSGEQLRPFDFQTPPVDSRSNTSHPWTGTRRGASGAPVTPFHGVRPLNAISSVLVPGVVPVFLRLPATSDPIEINGANNRSDILLTLDVAQAGNGAPTVRWWFVNTTDGTRESNIHFITVSNRIFAGPLSNLSYSIVSVYVAVLFTIGQFVRLVFGNQVPSIPYVDLPNANKLIMIVEGIYIARQKKQLAKEEILYRRLIKIYRTPALLLFLTAREDTDEEKRHAASGSADVKLDDDSHPQAAPHPSSSKNGLRARRTAQANNNDNATHETKTRR